MIIIYKKFIINYIEYTLTPNIILEFAKKYNTDISTSESIIIYNFIKRNYKIFLDGHDEIIYELKPQININLYNKIIELYNTYKSKYF